MNIQDLNLEDLRMRGERARSYEVPFKILATYSPTRLRHLLRHHDDETIEGDDTERRDAFDRLLAYYSLMEVASIAAYVPSPLPADYRKIALAALTNASVRAYYERKYPLLLPRAHRERLLGTWKAREKGADAAPLFASFAELNAMIERDDDVEMFLWFLEDGYTGDYSLEDLLDIVGDPERFAETLAPETAEAADEEGLWAAIRDKEALENPAELARRFTKKKHRKTPAESALHGFRKFLFFCRDLDHLLRRSADYPLLQSAMWHYHAYWFDELSDELRPYLSDAIDRFAAWDVPPEATHQWMDDPSALIEETRHDRAESVVDLRAATERLTSGEYGTHLRERFAASQQRARQKAATPQRFAARPRRTPGKRVGRPSAAAAARKSEVAAGLKRSKQSKTATGAKQTPKRPITARTAAANASTATPRKANKRGGKVSRAATRKGASTGNRGNKSGGR